MVGTALSAYRGLASKLMPGAVEGSFPITGKIGDRDYIRLFSRVLDVNGHYFHAIKHHVVNHGIVVDVRSKSACTRTEDVCMCVIEVPSNLYTGLDLEGGQSVVRTQSQFVINQLAEKCPAR